MARTTAIPRSAAAACVWRPAAMFALLLADFALLGLTVGAQGVLWAEIMPALRLSAGAFGSAQLMSPLVAVGLLLFGGQIAARLGKKRMGGASLFLLAAASLALAASRDVWGLVAALALLGAGNGLFETAMNGTALDWEQATGRSGLNVMHAGFSAGAVVGALGAGALLGASWGHGGVLALLALICGLMLAATLPVHYPPADTGAAGMQGPGATLRLPLRRPGLAILAVVCMLGAVGESVANLWSVIYLGERGAGAVLGGATFALLSAAMLGGRLANAPLVDRLGARVSLQVSGVGLVSATLLLLLPGGLPLAVAAFLLLGLAVAGVVPTMLGAGARLAPGNSSAVASGMLAAVYVSFLICPPLIGWLAEIASLQAALALVGLSGLGILWLARHVARPS